MSTATERRCAYAPCIKLLAPNAHPSRLYCRPHCADMTNQAHYLAIARRRNLANRVALTLKPPRRHDWLG